MEASKLQSILSLRCARPILQLDRVGVGQSHRERGGQRWDDLQFKSANTVS
jgi:hypothetical protein